MQISCEEKGDDCRLHMVTSVDSFDFIAFRTLTIATIVQMHVFPDLSGRYRLGSLRGSVEC